MNLFNDEKMEDDPRQFAVDDPYSDFDEEDHFNLLNPKQDINNFQYNKQKKAFNVNIKKILAAESFNNALGYVENKFTLKTAIENNLFSNDNMLDGMLLLKTAINKKDLQGIKKAVLLMYNGRNL